MKKDMTDKEILKSLMKRENMSDELKSDKDFMMKAVDLMDWSFKYASDELKNDKELVLKALSKNVTFFKYVSDELKSDKDVMLTVLDVSSFIIDKEILESLIKSDELKSDKDFMMKALDLRSFLFTYASDELKADKDVALAAIKQEEYHINSVDKSLKEDRNFAIEAVKINGEAIWRLNEEFQNDLEIRSLAAKQRGNKYINDFVEDSPEERKQLEEGDYTLVNERFFKMIDEDKTIDLIYLTEYNPSAGSYFDFICATTKPDENGVSRVLDVIPYPVYMDKGGTLDRVTLCSKMDGYCNNRADEDSYGDFATSLNDEGTYEWDIQTALVANNFEKAEELMNSEEYIVSDVNEFNEFIDEYLSSIYEYAHDPEYFAEEKPRKKDIFKDIFNKVSNYVPRTEKEQSHSISEIEEIVSDRQISNISKVVSEMAENVHEEQKDNGQTIGE